MTNFNFKLFLLIACLFCFSAKAAHPASSEFKAKINGINNANEDGSYNLNFNYKDEFVIEFYGHSLPQYILIGNLKAVCFGFNLPIVYLKPPLQPPKK